MRWTLLTLAMLLPLSAWGQSDADCTAIEDETKRVFCYNRFGDWGVVARTSNFDDSVSISMSVRSNETAVLRSGQQRSVTISAGCVGSISALSLFGADMYFASGYDGYGVVDYRVDSRAAGVWSMAHNRDNSGLQLWDAQAVTAIKELFGGDVLRVRFTPFNEAPVEVTFNIAGLEEQIVPLREACNW